MFFFEEKDSIFFFIFKYLLKLFFILIKKDLEYIV